MIFELEEAIFSMEFIESRFYRTDDIDVIEEVNPVKAKGENRKTIL